MPHNDIIRRIEVANSGNASVVKNEMQTDSTDSRPISSILSVNNFSFPCPSLSLSHLIIYCYVVHWWIYIAFRCWTFRFYSTFRVSQLYSDSCLGYKTRKTARMVFICLLSHTSMHFDYFFCSSMWSKLSKKKFPVQFWNHHSVYFLFLFPTFQVGNTKRLGSNFHQRYFQLKLWDLLKCNNFRIGRGGAESDSFGNSN